MADITANEVREFIVLKLPSESEIPAVDHRAVENKIMDYVEQELGKVVKSKTIVLENFTTIRNYSINTGLAASSVIQGVIIELQCKTSNNGYAVGDTVTAPTPYPADSGRTARQGIGCQYNNLDPTVIKVMINEQITIMTAYNSAVNAQASNFLFSGAGTANWIIKLIVIYK